MAQIRTLFSEANQEYEAKYELAMKTADIKIEEIIEQARMECLSIYENLNEMNLFTNSVRDDVEKINSMFSVGINFEDDWLSFMGVSTL